MPVLADLTAEKLRSVVRYCPDTGEFWRLSRNLSRPAGSVNSGGYVQIYILGKLYMAHRLAILYTTGTWPCGEVDHINGEKKDNRVSNLRDVTRETNQHNARRPRADSSTGVLGTYKKGRKYAAAIGLGGCRMYLGSYQTVEEAGEAYERAKELVHADAAHPVTRQ